MEAEVVGLSREERWGRVTVSVTVSSGSRRTGKPPRQSTSIQPTLVGIPGPVTSSEIGTRPEGRPPP